MKALEDADPIEPPYPDWLTLRHFKTIPIELDQLMQSTLWLGGGDARDKWYGFRLWCQSWRQVPAGSLPNNDVKLAELAGFKTDLRNWQRRKAGALRGWRLATDGRLYHEFLTTMVLAAARKSRAGKTAAETKWNRHPVDPDPRSSGPNPEVESTPPGDRVDPTSPPPRPPVDQTTTQPTETKQLVTCDLPKEQRDRIRSEGNRAESPSGDSGDGAKRRRRLNPTEALTDDLRQLALDEGVPAEQIDRAWERMRDWSRNAKDGACLDWKARWRNWIRRDIDDGRYKLGPQSAGSVTTDDTTERRAALRATVLRASAAYLREGPGPADDLADGHPGAGGPDPDGDPRGNGRGRAAGLFASD